MASKGSNNQGAVWAVVIAVVLALLCVEAVMFFQKKIAVKKALSVAAEEKKAVKPRAAAPAAPVETGAGAIAVVIDDWGYNKSHCKFIAAMPEPVAISVLPHLPYSHDVIACTQDAGKTPMLHLPLEPHRHSEMFDAGYVLTTTMGVSELKRTLLKILAEMPGVVGVNNHTGSKGSEDEALMTLMMSEVKHRGLFFVDSMTSDKSTGPRVAAKLKMHIAKRDIFLDNRNERGAIEHQFAEAVRIARQNGFALVIGHDRALSLQIITEQMKKLPAQGIHFLSVPDYIKQNEYPRN